MLEITRDVFCFTESLPSVNNCSTCHVQQIFTGSFDCSFCNFLHIPIFPSDAKSINLTGNQIGKIEYDSLSEYAALQFLTLAKNNISYIDSDAFSGLNSIRYLDLSSNKLNEFVLNTEDLCKGLVTLHTLIIHSNTFQMYPSKCVHDLVDLHTLSIDVFEGFHFTGEFLRLHKLKEIDLHPFGRFHLKNNSFEGLRNSPIQNLSLPFRDSIEHPVEVNFLEPFVHVQRLKIAMGITCDITDVLKYLYPLRGRRMLRIDLTENIKTFSDHHSLSGDNVKYLLSMCINEVDLSRNDIAYFPFYVAVKSEFGKCLKQFWIIKNDLTLDTMSILSLLQFPSLQLLDLRYISHGRRFRRSVNKTKDKLSSRNVNMTIYMNSNLTYFDISHNDMVLGSDFSFVSFKIIAPAIRTLSARDTGFGICNADVTTSNNSLGSLDMSGWKCSNLNPRFLHWYPHLSFLNASNCMLNHGLYFDTDGIFLRNLHHLYSLDFSHNSFSENDIHPSLFQSQRGLKYLYLNNNNFRHLPNALMKLQNVDIIDFRFNVIEYFNENDKIIIENLLETLFDFSGNEFDCSCKRQKSLSWMNDNRNMFRNLEQIKCIDKKIKLVSLLDNYHQFQITCLSQLWLYISIAMMIILVLALMIAVLSYRHKDVIVYFYLQALRYLKKEKAKTAHNTYQYDVFLSYSHNDYDWVIGQLYQRLSSIGLKVCVHHRDFVVGDGIAENIIRSIDVSKRALFVVTKDFIQSHWATFEMEMARNHVLRYSEGTGNDIIVIIKDPIRKQDMPRVLRDVYYRITCLHWPQHDIDGSLSGLFWRKLKETLIDSEEESADGSMLSCHSVDLNTRTKF